MLNGHTMFGPHFHVRSMRAETTGHPIACVAAFSVEAAIGLAEFQDTFCNNPLLFGICYEVYAWLYILCSVPRLGETCRGCGYLSDVSIRY